jgi:hypothetical protein
VPEDAGRNVNYLILRACERLDPRAVFGKAYNDLTTDEQLAFLGYEKLRRYEENPPTEA